MESETKVVGRRGKRRDQAAAPVVTNWQADIIDNKDPDYEYQFFRENEVSSKLRSTRVRLTDFETNESQVYDIPPWEIVNRDTGAEELAGFHPAEGKQMSQALTHGGGGTVHWCMKLPRKAWEILQASQEQRADQYEHKLAARKHYSEAWTGDGSATSPNEGGDVTPGEIRRFEVFKKESR